LEAFMPRYFFRLVEGDEQYDDDIGMDFEALPQARQHAAVVMQELGWRMDGANANRQLHVVSEDGEVLFRLPIVDESGPRTMQ
jgi:hypothetical protein